jgi:glyoxylase-like metal-dependent hydrolase (beta-lactamase superfamily II)
VNDISTERAGRSVSLTWYGQAGFRLAAGDSRVLIDLFLTDRDDRNYRPPARAADFADVTLVLCTHEHVDHLDLPGGGAARPGRDGAPGAGPARDRRRRARGVRVRLIRDSATPATVLAPARATPVTVALP